MSCSGLARVWQLTCERQEAKVLRLTERRRAILAQKVPDLARVSLILIGLLIWLGLVGMVVLLTEE